eukprot:6198247-Pleurochrysis_carterae.AAC.1
MSSEVEVKPKSTPPLTLKALAVQNALGSRPFETPRYTLAARVSLPSLTMELLVARRAAQRGVVERRRQNLGKSNRVGAEHHQKIGGRIGRHWRVGAIDRTNSRGALAINETSKRI